ncbi:MAG: DUF3365 domain-containing protein, partial [Spirulinaceae cyanobacterium RM2_2_10]|nr:DUF3365 domain-containing protein [Spirulinaceae cyanobacterium RM2_2_10]
MPKIFCGCLAVSVSEGYIQECEIITLGIERRHIMKLQIRIELILLAIFLAGWLSVVGTTYVMEQQQGVENTVNKAEVLMSAAIAARTYTSDEIATRSVRS